MCSKCPQINCVYVVHKRLGQRQDYTTVKNKCLLFCVVLKLLLRQELDGPFLVLLCRHEVDPLLSIVQAASY